MALTHTPGGAADNSYVTLAEAETYFADRVGASDNGNWNKDASGNSRTDAQKSTALVTATRRIDEERFFGTKTTGGQALKWPRTEVIDEDGEEYSSASIPRLVKEATYLTALELLRVDFLQENYLDNVDFMSTGTVQIKQFTQGSVGKLPAEARRLLRNLMVNSGGGRVTRA